MNRLPDGKTITVSIGIAGSDNETKTYQDIVNNADAAMYQAKTSGKNRVVVHEETKV